MTARLVIPLCAALLGACGGRAAPPAAGPAPAPVVEPARAVAPMDFGGQRVLVLPVQAAEGVAGRDAATAEVLFALGERDSRTQWITPEQLRSALRRAPGYAADPGTLPDDAYQHHGERYIVDPLGSVVRRYSALTDTRVVVIPRAVRWIADAAGGGRVRVTAAVIDARNGRVVWYGEADGDPRPEPDRAAVATAAAALAGRMLVDRTP